MPLPSWANTNFAGGRGGIEVRSGGRCARFGGTHERCGALIGSKDERSRAEHLRSVGLVGIDGDVGNSPDAEMSTIAETEQPGWSGAGHGNDLIERIFPLDGRERGHRYRRRRQCRNPLRAEIAIHEQRKDLRIGGKRRPVRMVGREEHARRVIDQQKQFEADAPLDGIVEIGRTIIVRYDAAAVRVAVEDHPFLRARLSARVELTQHVRGDGDGLSEHDLADIHGHALGPVHRLCQPRRRRGKPPLAFLAVAIELQVGEVKRQAFRRRDRLQRRFGVPRQTQVVAMDVQRMGNAKFVHRALQRLYDGA